MENKTFICQNCIAKLESDTLEKCPKCGASFDTLKPIDASDDSAMRVTQIQTAVTNYKILEALYEVKKALNHTRNIVILIAVLVAIMLILFRCGTWVIK